MELYGDVIYLTGYKYISKSNGKEYATAVLMVDKHVYNVTCSPSLIDTCSENEKFVGLFYYGVHNGHSYLLLKGKKPEV